MRGVRNIYHHSYTFSFLLVILILVFPAFSIAVNTLSSTESLTVSSNRNITSPSDVYELGFFKLSSRPRWYLGIWNKKVPERAYVWVANRDTPLSNSGGTLKILESNLVLLDHSDTRVWSTNRTADRRLMAVAELLDNGNFVLRDSNNNNNNHGILWQSFDFPTDTLLPEMKLGCDFKTGINRSLVSWKSADDPSSGEYLYKLEFGGLPEFFIWSGVAPMHRSGPWDGTRFSGIPEVQQLDYMVYNFTENTEEVTYTFLMTNLSIYSRLTLSSQGVLDRFTWIPISRSWNLFWFSPKDTCDVYTICGPYSYCDMNTSPMCNCIKGFNPKNQQQWSLGNGAAGCERKTPLSCRNDGFSTMKKLKLPDTTTTIVDREIGVKECKKRCLKDCNCTAFSNTDIRNGGFGCVIWTAELLDMRSYAAGSQDLYIKLADADADADLEEERKIGGPIIGLIVGVSLMLLFSFIMFGFWKRKQKRVRGRTVAALAHQERNQHLLINEWIISSRRQLSGENQTEDLEIPSMEFEDLVVATNNFCDSNKLGQGGFGIVYKGTLCDGQEVAVKRLSKMSTQGIHEFKNEVRLIAKLQHINLVRLVGCCVDGEEMMLIYEYLENLSLDSYLFDETQSAKLNWHKRFDIINGIARGLLYLHQDSRFRIIHRDLKASNILLDKDMTPKISDFGMARIFGRDKTEANTMKVVGTYGYMSPEYAMDGIFSMKSDVFSFGVLLLEIISGKRNNGFYNSNRDLNLLACVWRNWEGGGGLEIVDPIIIDSSSSSFQPQEVLRCIKIGLLCVQEYAQDRPMMSSVVLMLGSETTAIPSPKPPGYCVLRSHLDTDLSSSNQPDVSWTVNQITMSVIEGR